MAEEYVKGRLPQEENPTPGRYPGFVASHDVSEDGSQDMRITGKKNPLPSMLYGIDSEGNPKPVNVDENGNVLTQLTGSNVEKEIDRDVTITANGSKGYILDLDATKYMLGIFAQNNGDVNISVIYRLRSSDGTWMSGIMNLISELKKIYGVSEIKEVQTPQIYLIINNKSSTEDLTLKRLYVYKMR